MSKLNINKPTSAIDFALENKIEEMQTVVHRLLAKKISEALEETKKEVASNMIEDYDTKVKANPKFYKTLTKKTRVSKSPLYKKELEESEDLNEKSDILTKGKKLVSTHGEGKYTAKVYYDPDWEEHQVHYYKDGEHMGEGPVSYHSGNGKKEDRQEAKNSAEYGVKQMNSSTKKTLAKESEELDEYEIVKTKGGYVDDEGNFVSDKSGGRQWQQSWHNRKRPSHMEIMRNAYEYQKQKEKSSANPNQPIFHKVNFKDKDSAKAEGMKWSSGEKNLKKGWYHTDPEKSKNSKFETIKEAVKHMTASDKKKEKNLKSKYDSSDMKQKMIDQYGKKKGLQVYFATIRKQAMD